MEFRRVLFRSFASSFEITQYSVTGYWPKKLVNLKSEVRGGNQFIAFRYAFPILRLADLCLYYAEALNETKQTPDAEVYEYIDLIRARAGLEGRSEERRVGKECVRTCSYRWAPFN